MIKAVLLDLDDTLLLYPKGSGAFIHAYLSQLDKFFADLSPNIPARRAILDGVSYASADLDPRYTNQGFYWVGFQDYFPSENLDDIKARFAQFHAEVYPLLENTTAPHPSALAVVQAIMQCGIMVVIATNPIYSRHATEQRLSWAGIDPHLDFARITHGENSHFTKPHPHYYEEIFAQIGCEPYEAVMVGDNWGHDIVPAHQIGMRTFWIQNAQHPPDNTLQPDNQGNLADFLDCIQQGWLENLIPRPAEPHHIHPRLTANIAALFGTLGDIQDHFWQQHPDPKEWSPLEIVHHLFQYETEVLRPTLETILREDNPFIRPHKEPPQPYELNLEAKSGWQLARQWAKLRAETLTLLENLSPEAWERPARHGLYGLTTLLDTAILAARHDQLHIRQLCQTIGKCE